MLYRYGILASALLPLIFLLVVKYNTQDWDGLQQVVILYCVHNSRTAQTAVHVYRYTALPTQHLEESRTVMLHNMDPVVSSEATIR